MIVQAKDKSGRPIQAGDWVRLVEIPAQVTPSEPDTYRIFQLALGKTFRIEQIDDFGHAELNVSRKVERYHWIWVEPECLVRSRRRNKNFKEELP